MGESNAYQKAFQGDDKSLSLFLETVAEFDRSFCDRMVNGDDFTINIEVRGNAGVLLHARLKADSFKRPHGVETRIEDKLGKKRRKMVL